MRLFLFLILPVTLFAQKADFEAKRIKKHLSYLASDKLEGRGTGSMGEQLAAKYLIKQFEKAGLKPYGGEGRPNLSYVQSANIVGYLDNGADKTIVIGAHYDHLGKGDQGSSLQANSEGSIHNGADDNASGTSGLVELAHHYAKNGITEKHNFLFILFSGEELGLIGSKYFCDNPTIDLKSVNFMLNMDMIGRYREDKGLTIGGYGTSSFWGKAIPQIARNQGIKYNVDSTGVGPSDHTSFYLKNIPVLFFFTGSHSEYHKPTDDANLINYEGEAKILGLAKAIIEKVEESPKLDFVQTSNPHAGATRSTFKVTMGIMPDYSYDKGGVKVDGITKDRPAAKAGVLAGDVLLKLGDIETKDVQEYMKALGKFEKGQTVDAEIKRGNEKLTVKVTF
ncbi:MAG: M20/M25/M40 family metallo-hydrolase [Spirosomaceae bacterium]|nr:M20/M25/M40 family metallo-hydrolase [Spirosomataceae bacterium]